MKKSGLNLFKSAVVLLFFAMQFSTVFAQVPQKMTYQGIVRNASNVLIANTAVGMRVSVLQGSGGNPVYVETQTATTNINGLVTIEVGTGVVVSGTFAGINWANGPYYIKTETDPAGGTTYSISGVSELLSVPYALYAANGTPGATGAVGATGATGATGTNGTNGLNGVTGATGVVGATGAIGATGTVGTNGATGATGATGVMGATGAAGSANINGTTNYIVKFTAPTTGGNSQLFDNGTNVGLGTITPASKFNVYAGQTRLEYDYPGPQASKQNLIIKSVTATAPFNFSAIALMHNTAMGSMVGVDGSYALGIYDTTGLDYNDVVAFSFQVSSDSRVKKNIHTIEANEYESYLTKIRNIQSATYFYKNETTNESEKGLRFRAIPHIGFIAQSLPKEAVTEIKECRNPEKIGTLRYSLSEMIGLNTLGLKAIDYKQTQLEETIKQQQQMIEVLQRKIEALEKK